MAVFGVISPGTLDSPGVYGGRRALEREKFQKEFPHETSDRHSFEQESDSLPTMISMISRLQKIACPGRAQARPPRQARSLCYMAEFVVPKTPESAANPQ
jgi:hypothetical protein